MSGRRLARLGLLLALAMILSYVETLIPLSGIVPGMKIGLANLVTVFLLYRYRVWEALIVSVLRIGLTALLFGSAVSLLFSAAGFLVSFGLMWLLKKTGAFSSLAVSTAGGVAHNLAQIAVAVFVVGTNLVLGYLPVLFPAGLIAGALIGFLSGILIRRIPLHSDDRS